MYTEKIVKLLVISIALACISLAVYTIITQAIQNLNNTEEAGLLL